MLIMDQKETLFTVEDLAAMLQISEYKVRLMLRKGTIRAIKVDGLWRVRPAAYQEYLNFLDQKPQDKK